MSVERRVAEAVIREVLASIWIDSPDQPPTPLSEEYALSVPPETLDKVTEMIRSGVALKRLEQ